VKRQKILSLHVLIALLLYAAVSFAEPMYQLDIPAGKLSQALNTLALQAGIVLHYDPESVGDFKTPGLRGEFSLLSGFDALLVNTPLVAVQGERGEFLVKSKVALNDVDGYLLNSLDVIAKNTKQVEVYQQAQSIAYIPSEQLNKITPRNTSDVFSNVTGVSAGQSRQNPGVAVNVRGLQDFGRINVMIDGARQNFQQSGHGANGVVYIDPQLLSGVSISKGPVAGKDGAGAIGGVVNFNTLAFGDLVEKKDEVSGKKEGGRASITTGTNGYDFSGHVAGAIKLNEDIDLVVAAGRKSIGNFDKGQHGGNSGHGGYFEEISQFTGQDQWSALLKSNWKINEASSLKFSFVGFQAEFEEGSSTSTEGVAASTSEVTNEVYKIDHAYQPGGDLIDLSSYVYFTQTKNKQHQYDSSEGYGEFDLRYEINTTGIGVDNASNFVWEDAQSFFTIQTGMEFFIDKTVPKATKTTVGSGNADWYLGGTPAGERSLLSLYTTSEWLHDSGWSLLTGIRYEHFFLSGDGEILSGKIKNPTGIMPAVTDVYSDFDVSKNEGFFLPSVRLSYPINSMIQVFMSAASGVRPPSITETLLFGAHVGDSFPFYPNPGLDAEKSVNIEVGFNFQKNNILTESDSFMWRSVLFQNTVENFIVQGFVMSPTAVSDKDMILSYVNLSDRMVFEGWECQFDYDALHFFTTLSYTRNAIDKGDGGYDPYPLGSVVGYPETSLGKIETGGTLYIPPPLHSSALTIGAKWFDSSLNVAARMRLEDNNGRGGQSYESVVDWRVYDSWVEYKPSHAIKLRLAIDNLTDLNYAESNGTSYWIAPGRTYTATMAFKF
jgi:heme acquisition protein HasR